MQESSTAETTTPAAVTPVTTDNDKTLYLVAYILNLITTVCVGWTVIPLAWMIPMTVISYGIYKGTKKNTVAFGVCTLLFLNLISGILLLVAKKED
jgi:hypothetical protein